MPNLRPTNKGTQMLIHMAKRLKHLCTQGFLYEVNGEAYQRKSQKLFHGRASAVTWEKSNEERLQ